MLYFYYCSFNLNDVKKEKGLCIVHLNIRSILPKLDEVKEKFLDGHFQIIGLSETWLHNKIESALVQVEGYQLIRQDRQCTSKKRGGGLCLYVKEGLNVENLNVNVNNQNLELLGVKIIQPNQKCIQILLVY